MMWRFFCPFVLLRPAIDSSRVCSGTSRLQTASAVDMSGNNDKRPLFVSPEVSTAGYSPGAEVMQAHT